MIVVHGLLITNKNFKGSWKQIIEYVQHAISSVTKKNPINSAQFAVKNLSRYVNPVKSIYLIHTQNFASTAETNIDLQKAIST